MDLPSGDTDSGVPIADPVHIAVWAAFAACGLLIVLMSGVAGVSLAILVTREPPAADLAPVETTEMRRQRALQAIRDGDWERAVELTTEAVEGAPDGSDLAELRAISLELRDARPDPPRKVHEPRPETVADRAPSAPSPPPSPPEAAAVAPPSPEPSPTPEPPARSAVAERAVGIAVITSSPKGIAFEIPGVVRGETPYRAVGVPEGPHDVVFYLAGEPIRTERMRVPKNGVEIVDADLQKAIAAQVAAAAKAAPAPVPAPVEPAGTAEALDGPVTVYVFVPGAVKPRVQQEALQARLSGVTVTAFGTLRELKEAMAATPGDAVVAPRAVLEALSLPAHLQGRDASGSADQRYLLLGTRALAPEELDTATIGTVDVVGRDSSSAFVARLLNRSSVAQVKRVAEETDLLPLLQLGGADAILLPADSARALRASSQMPLVETEVAAGVGLPAISVLDEERRAQILAALGRLGPEANARVGVASWSRDP